MGILFYVLIPIILRIGLGIEIDQISIILQRNGHWFRHLVSHCIYSSGNPYCDTSTSDFLLSGDKLSDEKKLIQFPLPLYKIFE